MGIWQGGTLISLVHVLLLGTQEYVYEDTQVFQLVILCRHSQQTISYVWTVPDESDIQIVEHEQIIKSNFKVSYL